MSEFLEKIFGNQAVDDQPFPEIPPHTHDGQNSPLLAPASIDSVQIKSGAIGTLALADDSVSSSKIIDQAVLTEHLDALSVTEQKLANAAVATAKIKNGAVNASKLIQTEAVVTLSAQIDTAVIISAHIGTGVIQNAHLGNAIITNAKIVDGTIQTAKIGDAQITSTKIGNAEVKNANIENLAVTNAKIDTLSGSKIIAGTITAVQIAAGTITADRLNVSTLSAVSANLGTVTAGKISLGAGGSFDIDENGVNRLRANVNGWIARNGRGFFMEETTAGNYGAISVNASDQFILDLPTSNQFFIKSNSGGTNVFTASLANGPFAAKNGYLIGRHFDSGGSPLFPGSRLFRVNSSVTLSSGWNTGSLTFSGAGAADLPSALFAVWGQVNSTDNEAFVVLTHGYSTSGFSWRAYNPSGSNKSLTLQFLCFGN